MYRKKSRPRALQARGALRRHPRAVKGIGRKIARSRDTYLGCGFHSISHATHIPAMMLPSRSESTVISSAWTYGLISMLQQPPSLLSPQPPLQSDEGFRKSCTTLALTVAYAPLFVGRSCRSCRHPLSRARRLSCPSSDLALDARSLLRHVSCLVLLPWQGFLGR